MRIAARKVIRREDNSWRLGPGCDSKNWVIGQEDLEEEQESGRRTQQAPGSRGGAVNGEINRRKLRLCPLFVEKHH